MSGKKLWEQSSTGSIMFDGSRCRSDVLGEVNGGFKVMVTTLNGGRLFIAASRCFACLRARQVPRYAEERIQFDDKPIGRFQRVQDVIIDMDIALERNLTWLLDCCKQLRRGHARAASRRPRSRSTRAASPASCRPAMEVCGGVAASTSSA
jgi:alkylation response protein AidB-like acyl-CoA dehydrogenase